jgi:DNA-binding transcriptional MerR regulator
MKVQEQGSVTLAKPMNVRHLAKRGGVSVHVVRNLLRRGLLRASGQSNSGYRLFSDADLQALKFIRTSQHLGLSLTEIKEIIECSRRNDSPMPHGSRSRCEAVGGDASTNPCIDSLGKSNRRGDYALECTARLTPRPERTSAC